MLAAAHHDPIPPSIAALMAAYRRGASDPRAVIADSLALAQARADWHCFVELFADKAAHAALRARERLQRSAGEASLTGVPFAVKDIFQIGKRAPTAGTRACGAFEGVGPSPLLQRLDDLGAVLLGATNLDELCYGMTGLNPVFGAVRNPRDPSRIAGGSSSGAAAAVAAGIVPFAVGSDTGGSIRVPAALCGIVGFKPTLGRLSLVGAVPLSRTQDCAGLLARSVADILTVMALLDPTLHADGTEPQAPTTIGLCQHPFFDTPDPGLQRAMAQAAQALRAMGARLVDVDSGFLAPCDVDASTITGFEAALYHRDRIATQMDRFSEPTRARLERARQIQRSDYLAACARHAVQLARSPWGARCDALLVPTVTTQAPSVAALEGDPQRAVQFTLSALQCTRAFSYLGGPVISVPSPPHGGEVWGLQLVGRPGEDARLLTLAGRLERALSLSVQETNELP